jgi:ribosomal protein L37E
MKTEKRHLSDLFFDNTIPNDEGVKCKKCGKKANYLKDGICYDCFFGFSLRVSKTGDGGLKWLK